MAELPLGTKKEQFSLGFVHMVTSAAGFSIKRHTTDLDGVDITIVSSAQYEVYYCPEFELQVKCTSRADVVRKDGIAWPMEAGPLRRLTNPKRFCPAYLGVLVVPSDPESWLEQDEVRLLTNSRMYWQSAVELGPVGDGQSKTIYLPSSNLFDVPQLRGIMKTIGDGGGG